MFDYAIMTLFHVYFALATAIHSTLKQLFVVNRTHLKYYAEVNHSCHPHASLRLNSRNSENKKSHINFTVLKDLT